MNEKSRLRKSYIPLELKRNFSLSEKLWCGKVQGLCDGSLCPTCHLFPIMDSKNMSVERGSLISSSSLTDHKKIGFTAEDEEE